MRPLVLVFLTVALAAADVERITLVDGRELIGVYDQHSGSITVQGAKAVVVIRVRPHQVLSREVITVDQPEPQLGADAEADINRLRAEATAAAALSDQRAARIAQIDADKRQAEEARASAAIAAEVDRRHREAEQEAARKAELRRAYEEQEQAKRRAADENAALRAEREAREAAAQTAKANALRAELAAHEAKQTAVAQAKRKQVEAVERARAEKQAAAEASRLWWDNAKTYVGYAVLAALGLLLWLLPPVIAASRKHPNGTAILVLTLCSVAFPPGWIAALTWSVMRIRRDSTPLT